MEALIFGVADYAASIQSQTASIGGSDANYAVITDPELGGSEERDLHWGDQWHYPLSRIAVACRANGLRPIDGPFGDFSDPEGYLVAARRASILGFEGKWCIHPSQIELANEVFSPDDRLISRTRRIMAAMEEAADDGRGAVSLDGRLIDAASLRMATHLLTKIELIEERRNGHAPASQRLAAGG
jgi:malyl-CoA/(S)-citramalyl-CoA lyase